MISERATLSERLPSRALSSKWPSAGYYFSTSFEELLLPFNFWHRQSYALARSIASVDLSKAGPSMRAPEAVMSQSSSLRMPPKPSQGCTAW
jgi:hypothetical protein